MKAIIWSLYYLKARKDMSNANGIVIKPGKSGQPTIERDEGIYSHRCKNCGIEFLRKGKFAFQCDYCMKKESEGAK